MIFSNSCMKSGKLIVFKFFSLKFETNVEKRKYFYWNSQLGATEKNLTCERYIIMLLSLWRFYALQLRQTKSFIWKVLRYLECTHYTIHLDVAELIIRENRVNSTKLFDVAAYVWFPQKFIFNKWMDFDCEYQYSNGMTCLYYVNSIIAFYSLPSLNI